MMHEEKVYFENGAGGRLVGVLSEVNDHAPIVILAHGLGSSKDSGTYLGLQHGLNSHGINTFRFDFYGHGESEGKFQDITFTEGIRDVKQAYAYLAHRFKHVSIGLMGSSYGGAAVYYAMPDLEVAGVGLIAPALDNKPIWKKRVGATKIKEWEKKGVYTYTTYAGRKLKINYQYYEDCGKYTPNKVQTKVPMVFVHGDKDKTVPLSQSKAASKRLGAKLVTIKGADHNFQGVGEKDEAIHAIVAFFVHRFSMDDKHRP